MKEEQAYLVSIFYDEYLSNEFITFDKQKAELYCEKFNRIIKNNVERINHYYDDNDYDKLSTLWYDRIYLRNICAFVKPIKIR